MFTLNTLPLWPLRASPSGSGWRVRGARAEPFFFFLSSAPQPAPTHPDRPNWKKIVDGVEAAAKGVRSGEEEGSRRRRSNAEHRQRGAAGQARARAGAGCALENAKVGSHLGLDNEESGQERMEERRRQLEPNRCDSREERQRQEDTPREHRASPDPTLADVLERTVFRRHRETARQAPRAARRRPSELSESAGSEIKNYGRPSLGWRALLLTQVHYGSHERKN